jgi:hypothetical protein
MSRPTIALCQQSVDADVPASFAWQYMTNVSNWSDPPAEFSLEGPFADGAAGTTRMPDQPTRQWTIRGVDSGRGYSIEGDLTDGVRILVHWRFESLPGRKTRLTQRIELAGDRAVACADDVRAAFEPNLEPGMRRTASLMAQAWNVDAGPV